ncbi:MAG: protein phosphatase [Synechococcus sp.]|nr:protein phosphatase [Synechococcus sp.]
MSSASPQDLQGALLHFAVEELVRRERESFEPLWTRESWAKFLIWLSLQCGVGVSQEELESFAHALGPVLTGRLRRLFFERELGDLDLKVMADPADDQVLVMPLGPVEDGLQPEPVTRALERVGLSERLELDPARWQRLEALLVIPWANAEA